MASIDRLQARLRNAPKDWRSWAALGSAYVQRARITADPSYYPKAHGAFVRSLALNSKENYQAWSGSGALAAARHDFAGALRRSLRAQAINPYNAATQGVIGDAYIELGRYPEADAAFQRMVDLRPDLSSYARVSYTWELRGNIQNARRALDLALSVASSPSDAAFVSYYLGELEWNSGRLDKAQGHYSDGLLRDPSSLLCKAGLARVKAAQGHIDEAIADYDSVIERYPLPQFVAELGDLYAMQGRKADAQQRYALLHLQERLLQANGVNVDVELAVFNADHQFELARGLSAAQAEWSRRKSIFVADALAWQLYANGSFTQALRYSDQALRLGTRNASFFFHRGMINKALGRVADARADLRRAFAINPHFSTLLAPVGRRALAALGSR